MAVHREMLVAFILSILAFGITVHGHDGNTTGVTYDSRSVIVNGKRELLFSGSIHYTRSTPEVYAKETLRFVCIKMINTVEITL